jgi:hypothetical protein
VLIAIDVGTDGFSQILGVAEREKEVLEAGTASCVNPEKRAV